MAAEIFNAESVVRSMSEGRNMSKSGRTSSSLFDLMAKPEDVFQRSRRKEEEDDDEEDLKWEAIERLPTYDRMRKGIPKQVLENGSINYEEVHITKLDIQEKKILMESILKTVEEDNEKVSIEIPKIEVRFENLSIEGDAYLGTRALPTLLNSTMNAVEGFLGSIKVFPTKKRVVKILKYVSGIVRPSRYNNWKIHVSTSFIWVLV
ncbi:hypothetical protein K1719_004416 [Acacia pycnantha]|nr:hypothetical protein K1719_004416 [Acacia pycnantha]